MAVAVDSARLLLSDAIVTMRRVETALSLVGLLCVGKVTISAAWDILSGIRTHLWPRLFQRNLIKEYGQWGVIVGVDGRVGRGYADVLAGKGMSVFLISLTHQDLDEYVAEIESKHGVEVEVVDISIYTDGFRNDHVRRRFAAKEIGILVNNVSVTMNGCGGGGGGGGDVTVISSDVGRVDVWRSLSADIECVHAVTALVVPAMMRRRRGAVINVCTPSPTMNVSRFHVYNAAKSFLKSYSEVLRHTLESHDIQVQTVLPSELPHCTSLATLPVIHEVYKCVSPHQSVFATHALSTLGYTHTTSGYWTYGIMGWMMDSAPWWLVATFIITKLSL